MVCMKTPSAEPPSLDRDLAAELDGLRRQGLHRVLTPMSPRSGGWITVQGCDCLNLSSNDYLGLATDDDFVAAFYQGLASRDLLSWYGPGATGSRLMSGHHDLHQRLETGLAELYGSGAVLVFNSGYHANLGLLPALAGRHDLIVADKLCHASLVDGMRLSRAKVVRYPHGDLDRLRHLLAQKRSQYRRVFLVTESIFSMDGDRPDLEALVALKERFSCCLYLDEAHGVGVRGPNGLGCAEEAGLLATIDVLVGTFGKAWGGQGAFVVASGVGREFFINRVRPFIFTTGLPPVSIAWLLHVLDHWPQLAARRQRLEALTTWLRQAVADEGIPVAGDSHILPVMVGEAGRAVSVAAELRARGFWVTAVRPPTVPAGSARLRLSLTAAMDRAALAPLPRLLATLLH